MDFNSAIQRIYDQLEDDRVDKAVMTCLRTARNLEDFLYAAIFLREMYPDKQECMRMLYDDISSLKEEAQKFIFERSSEYWVNLHTLDFSFGVDEGGDEMNILGISILEIDSELEQWERTIEDLKVPVGMGAYDTAAFSDNYANQKANIRLRMMGLRKIKNRVKNRCLNYAIRIEKQLQAQNKSQSFLVQIHTDVNNYFKAHSDDVYIKLIKAAELLDSNSPEDCSLLLTQVRRAMKASADYFYPPVKGKVICVDGVERSLGEEQYLNRFNEFIANSFSKSVSRDLLKSEFDYLSVFARRLNEVASKGVHAEVSPEEAKQGLLGLYMFLHNVISLLQKKEE